MTERVPVKFVKSYRNYNPGEVAGFGPRLAGNLVEIGVAQYFKPAKKNYIAPVLDRAGIKKATKRPKVVPPDPED